jgi:hypothetical protein
MVARAEEIYSSDLRNSQEDIRIARKNPALDRIALKSLANSDLPQAAGG